MSRELLVCGNIARDIIFGNERYGGSAPAIAVNAKRMGISSGLLSVIGKDAFSERYRGYLLENDINIDLVEAGLDKLPECRVSAGSSSVVNVEWIDNGCHLAMETMKVDLEASLRYSVVHLVSCPPGLAKRLAGVGIKNLSYEPGPYIHFDSAYLDFAVVDSSRLIFLNEEEYQTALEISGLRSPRDFVADGRRVLVVTRGSKGSDLFMNTKDGFENRHVDVINPGSNIVDTTGAGDCYKSGFFAGFVRGRSLPECAFIGSYMGAACLAQEGGILPEEKIAKIKVICKI